MDGSLLITDMAVDRRSTYAEDDVSSVDVIVRMADDTLVTWDRADGRSHDRQSW